MVNFHLLLEYFVNFICPINNLERFSQMAWPTIHLSRLYVVILYRVLPTLSITNLGFTPLACSVYASACFISALTKWKIGRWGCFSLSLSYKLVWMWCIVFGQSIGAVCFHCWKMWHPGPTRMNLSPLVAQVWVTWHVWGVVPPC